MKNNILIGCDLHNTLLLSNEAWINSFLSFNPKIDAQKISNAIYNKKSRKELATLYNIDYEKLLYKYHEKCLPNVKLLAFVKELQNKGFQVVLISSSGKEKVKKDLIKINDYISFNEVYTKETFKKNNIDDWDRIIKKYKADFMIYIGNDYDEDIINNEKVISILSGHFLTELKQIGFLKERGK